MNWINQQVGGDYNCLTLGPETGFSSDLIVLVKMVFLENMIRLDVVNWERGEAESVSFTFNSTDCSFMELDVG